MYYKLIENPKWKPYCLNCTTMNRMVSPPKGFKCLDCRNEIDFDMKKIVDNKEKQ
jgi:hypothetical protein